MPQNPYLKTIFQLYDAGWQLAQPFLKKNPRLKEGFRQRQLSDTRPDPVHVWFQAASVGEAFLAQALLKRLRPGDRLKVLVSTNTRQGFEILQKDDPNKPSNIDLKVIYAPFDQPAIMQKAVQKYSPRVMVLLETELWPGLLWVLKQKGIPVIIVNGRMTPKSLSGYRVWPSLWRTLSPEHILAISREDAKRFATLFPGASVRRMHNIKFDRLVSGPSERSPENKVKPLLLPDRRLVVFGSVRQEEEAELEKVFVQLLAHAEDILIALFPRHMHRVPHWEETLLRLSIPFSKRSGLEDRPLLQERVILWDTIGELTPAYACAHGVFVGGSLAPLGGQNFLEPLSVGIVPVMGPSWENFAWVGREIIEQKLLYLSQDFRGVVRYLLAYIDHPPAPEHIRQKAAAYFDQRKGGTQAACDLIERYLQRRLT